MKKIKKQNGNYVFIFYNVPRRTKLVGTIDRFHNVSTECILVMKMIEYFGQLNRDKIKLRFYF